VTYVIRPRRLTPFTSRYVLLAIGWSDLKGESQSWMHGVAPHMCDQVVRPLLDQGAGGRSPGFPLFSDGLGDAGSLPPEILEPVRRKAVAAVSSRRGR
jgi:hypothetical protein